MNQHYKMKKIMTVTDEQRKKIQRTKQTKWVKELFGIPMVKRYAIGDSAVETKLKRIKVNDVLRCTHNGQDCYYIVDMLMGETMAFCYTLYPIG